MNPITRLFLGLSLFAIMLVAVAFALPQTVTVARSMVINVPESDVFPYVNNLKRFNEWQPWAARDPDMQVKYSGPPEGVGAKMVWKSEDPNVGAGSHEIVESEENRSVGVALQFEGQAGGSATYRLEPHGAGTKIVWLFETNTGNNPIQRWIGLMLDRWIGAEFETGLERLKKVSETSR